MFEEKEMKRIALNDVSNSDKEEDNFRRKIKEIRVKVIEEFTNEF